jgi:hypothetical protein
MNLQKSIVLKHSTERRNMQAHPRKSGNGRATASPVGEILALQKSIGNRNLQRLLKSGALQAKLKISQPGDIYEQEADKVASQIMSMSEPTVQRKHN